MVDCWSENPEQRPDFSTIRNRLKRLKQGMKTNIMDQMIEKLEKYSNNLEVSSCVTCPDLVALLVPKDPFSVP